jgi:hypothetical protein
MGHLVQRVILALNLAWILKWICGLPPPCLN